MNLSKRLTAIAGMVAQGNSVADVGCDHGFVPIWLVENKISPRALALDVRKGPLKRADEHIRQHHLEARIETRLSDGLENFNSGEADTLIMAGMGGMLMERILIDAKDKAKSFKELILSPQSDLLEFRGFLLNTGFRIDYERVVEDEGKYYFILHVHARPDDRAWTRTQLCFGRDIFPSDRQVLKKYLERQKAGRQRLCESMAAADDNAKLTDRQREREKELKAELELIEERLALADLPL